MYMTRPEPDACFLRVGAVRPCDLETCDFLPLEVGIGDPIIQPASDFKSCQTANKSEKINRVYFV